MLRQDMCPETWEYPKLSPTVDLKSQHKQEVKIKTHSQIVQLKNKGMPQNRDN